MPSDHDPVLISTLAAAYDSADRARISLDGALGRAALDALPSSPVELSGFLRTELREVLTADLGPVIADAVTEQLLALLGEAEPEGHRPLGHIALRPTLRAVPRSPSPPPAVEPPTSQRRPRGDVSIMLVRVDPTEEAESLDLREIAGQVLRVRHPLPACERMRVTRPLVVIVGRAVTDSDRDLLARAAQEIGAEIVEFGVFVAGAALQQAVRRAVTRASSRRLVTEHAAQKRA